MKKSFEKGFTLIELLVVVAIIGILSTVVLASLGTARNKAKDAKVKAQISSARVEAEILINADGDYPTSLCTTLSTKFIAPSVTAGATAIAGGANSGAAVAGCALGALPNNAANTSWAVAVKLPTGSTGFCVDSTGAAREYATVTATTVPLTCPTGTTL